MTYMDPRLPVRFWAKVSVEPETECWLWRSGNSDGYGQFWLDGKYHRAHRFAYEALVGPIPAGLQIDHLCRVRNCVNPRHLEPVTNAENAMRGESFAPTNAAKTHCPYGHAYTPENTYLASKRRACRTCKNDQARAKYRANRAALTEDARGGDR